MSQRKRKLLVVSSYWPPSGGSGVQRWLKLTGYLAELGWQIHVLTVEPDSANFPSRDASLESDLHPSLMVHRTSAFNPFAYAESLFGSRNLPKPNFARTEKTGWKTKLALFVRTHLFIPDPRKGWNSRAIRKGLDLIRSEDIDLVITTSPPHSSQLIGMELKRRTGIQWIADVRDPWTDVFYYNELGHSFFSRALDRRYEKHVLQRADMLITVGEEMKRQLENRLKALGSNSPVHAIFNGFDERDFQGLERVTPLKSESYEGKRIFQIVYTGTISESYRPDAFFQAVEEAQKRLSQVDLKVSFVGNQPESMMHRLQKRWPMLQAKGGIPHAEIPEVLLGADVLLLVIPDTPQANLIITGKVFEYLRSLKPILCLGAPDGEAANIIRSVEAGACFNRNEVQQMAEQIIEWTDDSAASISSTERIAAIAQFSRGEQAAILSGILRSNEGFTRAD